MIKPELLRDFDYQFHVLGKDLPEPVKNYLFANSHRWKFDRAWPRHKVAVELEGSISVSYLIKCHKCNIRVRVKKTNGSLGKVVRIHGWKKSYNKFRADLLKYNFASADGWIVLHFIHDDVRGNPFNMVDEIRSAIDSRKKMLSKIKKLSDREDEILHLIAAGMSGPEIAVCLSLSLCTIHSHTRSIREKLLIHNSASMVARASAWGLLDLERVPFEDNAQD